MKPKALTPMLATLADEPFHRPGWVYEEKYDGIRGLAVRVKGQVQLWSRNLIDRTASFPAVVDALKKLPGGDFLLDGEVVVFDAGGISRFQLWQEGSAPVFVVFDCLVLDGEDLMGRPWSERRAAVEKVVREGEGLVRRSRVLELDGLKAYAFAAKHGWEGIVAKDAASVYEPGKRSRAWLKVKIRHESELVVGGFTAPRGSRQDFGALLVGLYDGKSLRYCGKVGTGFNAKTLQSLGARLRGLEQSECPFVDVPRFRDATWVKPELVAQLAFHEWTGDGKLRHPAYLGLRDDKAARECRWSEREK
ncbi:MAG: non-homologous end-joining DNA ligase [Archangiaceae bacterium]|nr:non-homologous end-joining DNA ligase [Archangiaceae bacterium]